MVFKNGLDTPKKNIHFFHYLATGQNFLTPICQESSVPKCAVYQQIEDALESHFSTSKSSYHLTIFFYPCCTRSFVTHR